MRARFLQALRQPLEDIEVGAERLDRFRRPVVVLRSIEAKADVVDRALEGFSFGLALVEVLLRSREEEDEP